MSDEQFSDFCQANSDLRIERNSRGEVIIIPPAFTETGAVNFNLVIEFGIWAKRDGTGKGFDSSTGFVLRNGAVRSPDLSWIRLERWNALTDAERAKFAHICPDFVVELRSRSDNLQKLKEKMQEYLDNGVALGWLIDALERKVYIYRPGAEVEALENPAEIAGDPVLPGFVLDLREIWS
ncbi:MAG: Uma2 family endonuclease [Acidobacteria bacterium]|nr:Uma2 family endonuclease [Acidobacteriota bacterium]